VAVLAGHSTPSEASCVAGLQWHGQLYVVREASTARPGAWLEEPATIPHCHDNIVIYMGETKPRPRPPEPEVRRAVESVAGVPPTVAVLLDGQLYRNLAPLKAKPFAPAWPFRA
jgi:hypothetical protein